MTGCTPARAEHMLEDAARAYLHDRLSGKDTLLMCGTDAMAANIQIPQVENGSTRERRARRA